MYTKEAIDRVNHLNVDAVISNSDLVHSLYRHPVLKEGFSFDEAHQENLEGVIVVFDVVLNNIRKIDVGYEDEKSGITGEYVGVQTDDREFKLVPVKRNKQVDVPTEMWQKSIERRLAKLENDS